MGSGNSSESKNANPASSPAVNSEEAFAQAKMAQKLSKDPSHPEISLNAKRGCTDCLFLILFFLMWGVMAFVADVAVKNGQPKRLVLGSDYMGNICGEGSPDVSVSDWSERKLLWYPITYDYRNQRMIIREALKLGVCVKDCPDPSVSFMQPVYGEVQAGEAPPPWPVLFKSKPSFHRCLPNFFTFNCQGSESCQNSLGGSNATFARAAALNSFAKEGFEEVRSSWWIIVAALGIVVALSFLWLLVLRRLVKPVVIATAILVLIALIGLGVLFWMLRKQALELDPPKEDNAKWFLGGAITSWVIAFIYVCVMIFLWKDVMIACDIIEEATKVPLAIPSMLLVPPITLQAVIPFLIFFLIIAVYIQSSGDKVTVGLPTPEFVNKNNTNGSSLANSPSFRNITLPTSIKVKEYTFSNWRVYAHFYNLLMFLWSFGFLNAICFMIIAFCANFWYWSYPDDDKRPPNGSVCIGAGLCFRYHIGTLALGSLIVAIIQVMRVGLAFIEQRMKEVGERNDAVKFAFKVLHCYLAYLERVVKFINKNAYIVCAMTGKNFINSARMALDLLLGNALSVTAVTVISEYVMTFGKFLITIVTCILTWVIIKQTGSDDGVSGGALVMLIVLVLSYLVACLFTNVFSVCIDTVLLCFCYDKMHRTYDYFPSDLKKHVDAAQARKSDAQRKAGAADNSQEMQKPLVNSVDDL